MSAELGLQRWHAAIANCSRPAEIAELLAEDAVFHSPVVHTPQRRRTIVTAYLSAAGKTLGNESFHYVRELVDGDSALLEFETELEGTHVNGIDLIRFNSEGRIVDFKVMVRPLKAVNKVWEVMAAQLQESAAR